MTAVEAAAQGDIRCGHSSTSGSSTRSAARSAGTGQSSETSSISVVQDGGDCEMRVSRRTMILGTAAAALARPALAQGKAKTWFDRAIVIDALGSAGDPYGAEGVSRMSDRGWAETGAITRATSATRRT
jgi:hypothetical protein